MSAPVTIPDHKIALRDYLRSVSVVTDVVSVERIVLSRDAITNPGNWLVLSRAGGSVDMWVPLRRPRVDLIAYGSNRYEANRLLYVAGVALGIYHPRNVPRIASTGVIITDIYAESDGVEGDDDSVPGVEATVPFTVLPIRLTVHEDTQ
jgi:hypothetical protein